MPMSTGYRLPSFKGKKLAKTKKTKSMRGAMKKGAKKLPRVPATALKKGNDKIPKGRAMVVKKKMSRVH